MRTVLGVPFSDNSFDKISRGDFTELIIANYKEKQAVVKICAESGINIKVVPMGGNVHKIIKMADVCPTCKGKGYL